MRREYGYILTLIITVAAMMSFSLDARAQEIVVPERWTDQLWSARPLYSTDTLEICILGDVMMHTRQIEDALQPDSTYSFRCFDLIRDRIASADIAIANMEFTLAGKPYTGYPAFSAPDSFADYLTDCGFDVFLTANNHILDKGSEGARRTGEIYSFLEKSKGIRFTGISLTEDDGAHRNPLTLRRKGYNIAIVNMTYGTNLGKISRWPEVNYLGTQERNESILNDARESGADIIAVFPHWGTEYSLTHSSSQEKTALWLAEHGADLIIGAHPHVVQDFQTIGPKQVPTVYSLGNAVSNMSAPNTQIELMATVRIIREPFGKARILPVGFTYLWCSRPGGYSDTYTVIPVREFIGTRDIWKGAWEYDKMIETYYHVMSVTGINYYPIELATDIL